MRHALISGWGKCVPPAILSNDDLATFMDTSDEWIASRTGIKERRICHCNFSDMAVVAARHALAAADMDPMELDLILLGSLTNDSLCPNTASLVADELGARNAAAIDINSACTGFLYGLHIGTNLIRTGAHNKVLVIGGEFISHYMNWAQRDVAVLFGDACGAAVLEPSEERTGLLAAKIGCEADAKYAIQITNLGSAYSRLDDDFRYIDWNFEGQEVFKRAVKSMAQACADVLEETGVSLDEVNLVVPHQANKRILDSLAKRVGIPAEKVFVNVHKYGNTSAGTIPVALTEAVEEGRVKSGDYILTASFGAGLTWGAGLIKWGDRVTPLKESDAELPPCNKTALEILEPQIKRYLARAESKV
ncbi:MAG: ketoacyl-ACP synthase III [Gammaproteobacteria bacterium]|jgi:3-oxoacyl-[acyl-carrier-protein] synthase III|nr:ketoacyl-ACP synthase III [Gammaproteobacteria bacterium]MBT3987618.1 ketoacyl-ACP synthase III [Gammaproteobacteria bacterium]MBT4581642.1 ketoacyl-ACP synthase III [Gammaproteobacteria bacterium]MBT4659388.1 ketoacyl-ACP synthase III [Gammaproteobacteria bacterium]MBT4893317.1 ketoacyl-ACP synthase III [Gammaproteobacteria bacterium]